MGQSGKHRGQYTGDRQKYSSRGNQNQMHYYSLGQGKALVLEKKTTTQGFSGPEQLPETDMVAAPPWLAPRPAPPLSAAVYF